VRDGSVQFIPEEWTKTYNHWLENIQDWCISRQLWWGHRIPVWYKKGADPSDPASLHVATQAPPDPENWEQDEDVLDTWFSSSLWPFSILGWPQDTPEQDYFYPTAFLSTGPDIIFFWVARMIMMGLHFKGDVPFKTVFFHPMIVDEHGKKMSKTKGNVIDPLALKADYGIDALRFTLVSGTAKGKDLRLSLSSVDSTRKFLNKIWNASRFVLSNLEGYTDQVPDLAELQLEDRWILARLQATVAEQRRTLERYDFNLACSTLYGFIWGDFCDWYLEWVKPRLYGEAGSDKTTVQAVLHHTLKHIVQLLHPFVPFLAEELWQHLPFKLEASVVIAPYPQVDPKLQDAQAERDMETLQQLIVSVRTMRSELNIPPDKPVPVLVRSEDKPLIARVERYREAFASLAHVDTLDIGPHVVRPAQAPRKVLDNAEVFLPLDGVIDIASERVRLTQELSRVEADLNVALHKLENEDFLSKAPPAVVEKEKNKLSEFQQRAQRLEQNLALLGVKT